MSESAAQIRRRWGRHRWGYLANYFMLAIGSRCLWLGYAIIFLAAAWFYCFVPKARRASLDFHQRLHVQTALTKKPSRLVLHLQVYRHMVTFGKLLLDRAIILASDRHGFKIRCQGENHLKQAAADHKGLLLLTAHFGIAEAGIPYLGDLGQNRQIHLVMYFETDDATERFHSAHRRQLQGVNIISTADPLGAGIKIITALKCDGVVGMRADRALTGKTLQVDFFGESVHLPAGPFLAAMLTGAPVISIYTLREGYKKYSCTISAAKYYGDDNLGKREERITRAAQDYATLLESLVRKAPEQWSNFFNFWQIPGGDSENKV